MDGPLSFQWLKNDYKSFDMTIDNPTPHLPIYLPTHPSINLPTYLLTYPPTHGSPTNLPTYRGTHRLMYLPIHPFTYLLNMLTYLPTFYFISPTKATYLAYHYFWCWTSLLGLSLWKWRVQFLIVTTYVHS